MKNKNEFEFKYVAPTNEERKEIESIRRSYTQKKPTLSKLDRLRALDAKVKGVPQIYSLVLGLFGILLFGLGLAMILEWKLLVWGIVVCAVSLVPMALAYPLHLKISKNLKAKHSDEILALSEELLNEGKIEK